MSLIVKNEPQQYELPEEGTILAVLSEVKFLDNVQTAFGTKNKVRFRWIVDAVGKDGKPLSVLQSFNRSIHEKSSLRKALKAILGREPGNEIDLERLIGTNVQLVLVHNQGNDGRMFAKSQPS